MFWLSRLTRAVATAFNPLTARLDSLVAELPNCVAATLPPYLAEALARDDYPSLVHRLRKLLVPGRDLRSTQARDLSDGNRHAKASGPAMCDFNLPHLRVVWGSKPIHEDLWNFGGDGPDRRAEIKAVEQHGFDDNLRWGSKARDKGDRGGGLLPQADRDGAV